MEQANEAAELALKAIDFDKRNCIDAAVFFYNEAARLLTIASQQIEGESQEKLLEKASEYRERAKTIVKPPEEREYQKPEFISLNKCKFLFRQALDADDSNDKEAAIKLYTDAIELSLQARKETDDKDLLSKLSKIIHQAIDRAEELKGIKSPTTPVPPVQRAYESPDLSSPNVKFQRTDSQQLKVSGKATYTEEEKQVLLATSKINKHEYVPFMHIDLNERFQYAIPFTDKDGPLALSPKQLRDFSHWARPEEICSDPVLIAGKTVDCFSIKQTIVSDCSFVASLAVGALYERKFNKRLITKIIYPRRKNKEPLFNPFGKYMIKLHLNGVTRKVIIDDTLPVNKYNQLLSSFSTKKNEMWISLLEKAYMKVMGGYDFPGSNSNIDLHALTGWIPERIQIKKDATFNAMAIFDMLEKRMAKGHVLVTVATGEIPEEEAERAGLVPTHAYAVLDVKTVMGKKLLLLKNPWSHIRWRGNFSELDTRNWTPEMCAALKYDPKSAASFDDGVFWIDYSSILQFYDVFYLNWDPAMFTYTFCIHQSWSAGVGPVKDTFNIGDNPQFRLNVGDGAGAVWILLTRHITDIEDFKNNREYITTMVYKNNGNRVYYPDDPPPYLDGIRINSPHYLSKIILSDTTERIFTLVISQYEKTVTIYYTLRVYATCPFNLEKIIDPFHHVKKIDGEWKGQNAGGCGNHPTFVNNPRYRLNLVSLAHVCIDLKAPRQFQIGFVIFPVNVEGYSRKDTGAFRSGFAVLDLKNVPPGDYDIVPSTFLPNQESKFFLTFKCSVSMDITRIK